MTDFLIKFAKIIKNSDRAIYAYEPVDGDTINNGTDLAAYATKKGGGNAVDGMLWAAYSVMLNPSAKAAVARGDIDVEGYFCEAMKDSYKNGITAVSDALNIAEDQYYGEMGQLSMENINTAEQMLATAQINLRNLKAGQDGYKEAVAELDKTKENMLNILLMYPSPKTMIESILNYFFQFLAGFGDGTNWRTHQEIMDGLFKALPELSLSVTLKDWWKYGASKNYHPAMIAENYFRYAVEAGDINRLEFRKDQIIKWMSTARIGGRKEDIFIARQGISDDLWDNYKEQVIEKYQKGARLIKEGVTAWDEEATAAKLEEEDEASEGTDESDASMDDLDDEQIKKIMDDIDEKDIFGGEEYEEQLRKDIKNCERQHQQQGELGPSPLIEDEDEIGSTTLTGAAEDEDDEDEIDSITFDVDDEGPTEGPTEGDDEGPTEGDDEVLTKEQVEMFNKALGIDDDNGNN